MNRKKNAERQNGHASLRKNCAVAIPGLNGKYFVVTMQFCLFKRPDNGA